VCATDAMIAFGDALENKHSAIVNLVHSEDLMASQDSFGFDFKTT
jgi:hypothetical protein